MQKDGTGMMSPRPPAKRPPGLGAVPGVGDAVIQRLHAQGIRTLRALARSNLGYALQAQSILSDSPIFSDIILQKGCAYLDIESITFHRGVFLIGVLYQNSKNRWKYTPITAETEQKLAREYNKFFSKHIPDCDTIYHWGAYDATNMRRINCKHTDRLCDMLKAFKKSCILPVSSYSIKDVADYCKYDGYGQTDVSGVECGHLWNQYTRSGDKSSLDRLLKYNRIDCEAMVAVYRWYGKQRRMSH